MKNEALSMAQFKKANGELKTLEEMNPKECLTFALAQGMKKTIETLEVAIESDRVFSRAKFSVMSIFHSMYDELNEIKS